MPSSCTRFFFFFVSATLHPASAPLLTYKSRFVERDLPSTSVISKCTCSSPTPGAIKWSSLRRRDQRLDHSLPLPSAPAHLRCQVFSLGEIYVSTTRFHSQCTCIIDARSSPVARSTPQPLTTTSSPPAPPMPGLLPWRDLRLGHSLPLPAHLHLRFQVYPLWRDQRLGHSLPLPAHLHLRPIPGLLKWRDLRLGHSLQLQVHLLGCRTLPSTLITCVASRFATRPNRTGCT